MHLYDDILLHGKRSKWKTSCTFLSLKINISVKVTAQIDTESSRNITPVRVLGMPRLQSADIRVKITYIKSVL